MAKKKQLEVLPADAERVIENLCHQIEVARDQAKLEPRAYWSQLEQLLYDKLEQRRTDFTELIVKWARRGHPSADAAARRYIKRQCDLGKHGELLEQLKGYLVWIVDRAPAPYPTGQARVMYLFRDAWILAMLINASNNTGLPPTRNKATLGAPSIAYYLAIAFERMKGPGVRKLNERSINEIFWRRGNWAQILEASMPR
jgi:hypothetical protein